MNKTNKDRKKVIDFFDDLKSKEEDNISANDNAQKPCRDIAG